MSKTAKLTTAHFEESQTRNIRSGIGPRSIECNWSFPNANRRLTSQHRVQLRKCRSTRQGKVAQ